MPYRSSIYLNNAASSWPKAPGVADAVIEILSQFPTHSGRSTAVSSDPLTECRERLVNLMGLANPQRMILTTGATQALNVALLGLELNPGDSVVSTVLEHNSVLRPLHHLALERDIQLKIIGLDEAGQIDSAAFRTEVEQGAALVVLNHVSNVTGQVTDPTPLFEHAHSHGALTLLDASQSVGHLAVDFRKMSADLIAFTGHKGLLGPAGTGGLYIAENIELKQVLTGGTGVRSDLVFHPEDLPVRHEMGTPALHDFAGLGKALEWLIENQTEHLAIENCMSANLRDGLRQITGVNLIGSPDGSNSTGVVSFTVDGWSVADAGQALTESFGIVCRDGLHCAPLIHKALGCFPSGSIRFSASGFTTNSEIDRAVAAVSRLVASA